MKTDYSKLNSKIKSSYRYKNYCNKQVLINRHN